MSAIPSIEGSCDERFAAVRDALADNFRERERAGRGRGGHAWRASRSSTSGRGGWTRRGRSVAARHARGRLLGGQGDGGAVRAASSWSAGRSTSTRRWRATGRSSRPRARARSRCACSCRTAPGCPRSGATLPDASSYDWELMVGDARGGGAVVGAGVGPRLPREHVRLPGRRAGAARQRRDASGSSSGARSREPLAADFHFGLDPSTTTAHRRVRVRRRGIRIRRGRRGAAAGRSRRGAGVPAGPRVPEPARAVGHRHGQHARLAGRRDPVGQRPRDRAGGITRIYGIAGRRLLAPETLAEAIARRTRTARTSSWGGRRASASGSSSPSPSGRWAPIRAAFGHFGAGGSLGFADPDAGLAFAYMMNRAGPRWQNPRNRALIDAVYACL